MCALTELGSAENKSEVNTGALWVNLPGRAENPTSIVMYPISLPAITIMRTDHRGPKIVTLSHVHDSLLVLLCIPAYLFAASPIISIIDCSNVAVPIMNTILTSLTMAIANLLSSAISYHHELTFANPTGPKASLMPGENEQRRCIEAKASKSYHLKLLEADGQQLLRQSGTCRAYPVSSRTKQSPPCPGGSRCHGHLDDPLYTDPRICHHSAALAIIAIPVASGTFPSTVLVGPQHRSPVPVSSQVHRRQPSSLGQVPKPRAKHRGDHD